MDQSEKRTTTEVAKDKEGLWRQQRLGKISTGNWVWGGKDRK